MLASSIAYSRVWQRTEFVKSHITFLACHNRERSFRREEMDMENLIPISNLSSFSKYLGFS